MVNLFDFPAFVFHNGLDRLQDAFHASITKLKETQKNAEAAHREFIDIGEYDYEYDENGILISSTQHQLLWEELQALDATAVLCEAFVSSIFHYWECSARIWTNDHKSGFQELTKRVRRLGYPIEDDLELLNCLNNLLKHGNPKKGHEVFKLRPSLFIFEQEPIKNYRSALRITDEDVMHFIAVVRVSGPRW